MNQDTQKFEIRKYDNTPSKVILTCSTDGDMIYLFLSLYQARYLLDELKKTIKAVNKSIINDEDTLVVPFPKEEKENE